MISKLLDPNQPRLNDGEDSEEDPLKQPEDPLVNPQPPPPPRDLPESDEGYGGVC